ncbi:MAG: hypothetical protein RIQ75_999, partial [Pseudomonadota bacterium]
MLTYDVVVPGWNDNIVCQHLST